jgi:hypothetical protein
MNYAITYLATKHYLIRGVSEITRFCVTTVRALTLPVRNQHTHIICEVYSCDSRS